MPKNYSTMFLVLYVISLLVSFQAAIAIANAGGNFKMKYKDLDFSSSMRGVNYEIFLPNEDDPAEFCLVEGRSDDLRIITPEYFYITQGDQLIHGIAVENDRFEINQQLSGCWNVMREKDNLRVRLINRSNSDIFFKTKDTNLENIYTEQYRVIMRTLIIPEVTLAVLFVVLFVTPMVVFLIDQEDLSK